MRVLLVDDEENTLRAVTHLLDRFDVEIVPTPDSAEAAKHIINQNFDAMIIDALTRWSGVDPLSSSRVYQSVDADCPDHGRRRY